MRDFVQHRRIFSKSDWRRLVFYPLLPNRQDFLRSDNIRLRKGVVMPGRRELRFQSLKVILDPTIAIVNCADRRHGLMRRLRRRRRTWCINGGVDEAKRCGDLLFSFIIYSCFWFVFAVSILMGIRDRPLGGATLPELTTSHLFNGVFNWSDSKIFFSIDLVVETKTLCMDYLE